MERNRLGVAVFLLSEVAFFIFLILAYVYLHNRVTQGPTPAQALDPASAAIYTIFLLASSLTVWLAGRSLRRHRTLAWFWLAATVVLGLIFLIGQGREWRRLYKEHIYVSTNVFGTSFFTLTGFHGLHVLMGLIALTILLGLVGAGRIRGPNSAALESVSIYWHFVDVVWIVIFTVIYVTVALRV